MHIKTRQTAAAWFLCACGQSQQAADRPFLLAERLIVSEHRAPSATQRSSDRAFSREQIIPHMLAVSHEHRKQHDLSLHRWQRITQRKTKRAMCLCHSGKLSEGMMRDEQTARPGRLLLCIAHHLLQCFLIQPKRRDLAQSAQCVLCLCIQLTALDERQLNMNGEQAARRLDERGQLIQAEHLRTARDDPSAGKAETTT